MSRDSLARLVAGSIASQGSLLELVVFGDGDPDGIARGFDEWTRRHLGAGVDGAWWYRTSVGAVAAVRLADGRDVVVKALPPRSRRSGCWRIRRAVSSRSTPHSGIAAATRASSPTVPVTSSRRSARRLGRTETLARR